MAVKRLSDKSLRYLTFGENGSIAVDLDKWFRSDEGRKQLKKISEVGKILRKRNG
jgi:hypothetical protein